LWRGHQVGFRQGRAYYEERDASGARRGLAFDWFRLTEGYRPRGLVRLSPRDTWDLDAPVWARGHRDECGERGLRAPTKFGLADGAAAVFSVCEFLADVCMQRSERIS
jgi:hypothetical protein